mmetsp:Transcript_12826/g.25069  ORF Transcript_12826/g.25069 Transcript_12826/m.25069 type:complete len:87 (+) Transcript_12826:846-1106(+)
MRSLRCSGRKGKRQETCMGMAGGGESRFIEGKHLFVLFDRLTLVDRLIFLYFTCCPARFAILRTHAVKVKDEEKKRIMLPDCACNL